MQRFSAPILVSVLVLAACPADSNTTVTATDPGSTGGSSSGSSTNPSSPSSTGETPTTVEPTTAGPTTLEPTSDATTDATTGGTTTAGTTTTGVESTTTTGDGTTTTGDPSDGTTSDTSSGGVVGVCGDGMVEGDEACDDKNTKTEVSASKQPPLKYDAAACIDDCSLVLGLCGDGKVDPGEACDDGNGDSYDGCTTSCTLNDKGYHAPCKRMCDKNCDTDVSSGTFTGCDNMTVPAGAKAVCYVSTKFNLAPRYFAEGDCATTAQTCSGGPLCPPNIGNYDTLKSCPAGSTLIDRTTMSFGLTVKTKVCHKTCESDADCRWNAYDGVWAKPGQFRCQVTDDSMGVKICADGQN